MIKKNKFIIGLSLALGCALSAAAFVNEYKPTNVYAEHSYSEIFDYSRENSVMKNKTAYSDASVSDKKGLFLYSYSTGAKAEFKGTLSGIFESDFAVLGEKDVKPDLKNVSFEFTDKKTDKSFSVGINTEGAEGNCYVGIDGQKAGLVYATDGKLYNYSALYNRDNIYTSFNSAGEIRLKFDTAKKQVFIAGEGKSYRLVWDFTKKESDGKLLEADVSSFDSYSVSVVFNDMKFNGKAEMLLYTFGGISLDKETADSMTVIGANFKVKPIVGEKYEIPSATVEDVFTGKINNPEVNISVYDELGNGVPTDNNSFTASKAGEYYIYYSYGDAQNESSAFYCVDAIESKDIETDFITDKEISSGKVGLNTVIYIPKITCKSSYSVSGTAENTVATIFKDGEIIESFDKVDGGFDYTFTEIGEYEIMYCVPDWNGKVSKKINVTVSGDIVGCSMENIPDEVKLGSTIKITPAEFYIGGNEERAAVCLITPSGKELSGTQFTLDELGNYTVEHRWSGGIKTQSFSVKNLYSDLFTAENGCSSNYEMMDANNSVYGQMITLVNNRKVTYNKIINLAESKFDDTLSDKTDNKPLLECVFQPNTVGRPDMTGFYVTLTDVYDPENTVVIRMKYMDYMPDMLYIRTKATGQGYAGYYYDGNGSVFIHNAQSHEDGGFVAQTSFSQKLNAEHDMLKDSLKLYFDYDKLTLYSEPWEYARSAVKTWAVRDYGSSDKLLGCGDNPWRGFTTGEVYLSVHALGVESTAGVMITKIAGEDLRASFISDNTAPQIKVFADENNVPYGQAEKPYKIFDYEARDLYSKVIDKGVKVFYGNSEIVTENGYFIPQAAEDYTILYSASDSYGNVAKKRITVQVKSVVDKPEITIEGSLPAVVYRGQKVYVPSFTSSGIGVTDTVEVTCGGEPVEVDNGTFVCEEEGTYTVRFIATDYIGLQTTQSLYIKNVAASDNPIFDENSLVLPQTFINGDEFTFAEYNGIYYTLTGVKKSVAAEIEITDGSGTKVITDGIYVPCATEAIRGATVRFIFEKDTAHKTVIERVIPIITIVQKLGFMADYFKSENAIVKTNDNCIYFSAEIGAESMNFAFIRPIDQGKFSLNLLEDKESSDYGYITVKLRDTVDSDNVVLLKIRKIGEVWFGSVNGSVEIPFSLNDKGEIVVKYLSEQKTIADYYGSKIGIVGKCLNGKEFDGFKGNIYADVTVSEIKGDASIGVSMIANQGINNNRSDRNAPLIIIDGYLSGNYEKGDTVIIPSARSYDVLNGQSEVTLTVSRGGTVLESGTSVKTSKKFVLSDFGEYEFAYTSKDTKGNVQTTKLFVTVTDNEKPVLVFSENLPETASIGQTVKIPSYNVEGNNVEIYMYYTTPDGLIENVKDNSVKFEKRGLYTVYIIAKDANDNSNYYYFNITVK